jgi:hypothetical protein
VNGWDYWDAAEFIAEAKRKFPGSRELPLQICENCGERGRWSDALSAVSCDDCWRPRFYGGSPEVAERARKLRGEWRW